MNNNKEKPGKALNYTAIIKDSKKFYVSVNDNIQFLLNPNELAIFLKVIHINNIGKNKQSKEYFALTTRLSKRTIDKTLEQLVRYGLIHIEKNGKTTNTYKLNLEVIQGIYKSLNSIKEIEGKQRWCEIYMQKVASMGAEFTPLGGAKNASLGVQNLHVRGAKIVSKGVQNLHPNKEDTNKENINKEDINKENFSQKDNHDFHLNNKDNLVSDASHQDAAEETITSDNLNIDNDNSLDNFDLDSNNIDNLNNINNKNADKSFLRDFEQRNDNSIQLDIKVSENASNEAKSTLSNEDSDIEEFYERETDRMLDNFQSVEAFMEEYQKVLSQLESNYPKEASVKYINRLKKFFVNVLKNLAVHPKLQSLTPRIEKALEITGLKDLYNSLVA